MNKAQQNILFAAALATARDLPKTDPNRARLADAMQALQNVKLDDAAFPFEITAEHVRDPRGTLGRVYFEITNAIGRILPCDIGKRCYRVNGIVQVENNEQRDARVQA